MPDILIVDDDETIREGLKHLVLEEGYHVVTAVDGADALQKLSENNYRLILLDVRMPNLDGYDVLTQVKKLYQSTKVIMITGHADLTHAMKSKKMGADDFIEKPFDIDDVMTSVRRSLGER